MLPIPWRHCHRHDQSWPSNLIQVQTEPASSYLPLQLQNEHEHIIQVSAVSMILCNTTPNCLVKIITRPDTLLPINLPNDALLHDHSIILGLMTAYREYIAISSANRDQPKAATVTDIWIESQRVSSRNRRIISSEFASVDQQRHHPNISHDRCIDNAKKDASSSASIS